MRIVRVSFLVVILTFPLVLAAQPPVDREALVDRLFQRWDSTATPGCAVAVARRGRTIFSRAYGMADIEHGIVNSVDTIFEAGSVSKQFTAAVIILLSQQGKLSVDDNVRKYIPEVPEYGTPITIRHMMNHISGLRDWGSVAGISGWGRGSRVHTHDHVLDIVSRQSALNFPPGREYSYSNTGYNLQAVIVDRVSGMSFAEFSKNNVFRPAGMAHTEWRDDYRRIVKNRAVAYQALNREGFAMNMPFENVHGNGGLLTTVGDLLIWTENLETGAFGGPEFLEAMHHQGRLNSGRQISYASGLRVASYRGVPEVGHTGSTAGYRAFLARYPEQRLAISLLCNVANVNPGRLGHQVADVFLGNSATSEQVAASSRVSLPETQLRAKAGLYRNTSTAQPMRLVFKAGVLRLERGGELVPLSSDLFRFESGNRRFTFEASQGDARPRIRENLESGEEILYEPVAEFTPTAGELAAYEGDYYSSDAETELKAMVEDDRLFFRRRPNNRIPLTPVYADTFQSSLGLIRFLRDATGRVTGLSLRQSRVYDMRFGVRP